MTGVIMVRFRVYFAISVFNINFQEIQIESRGCRAGWRSQHQTMTGAMKNYYSRPKNLPSSREVVTVHLSQMRVTVMTRLGKTQLLREVISYDFASNIRLNILFSVPAMLPGTDRLDSEEQESDVSDKGLEKPPTQAKKPQKKGIDYFSFIFAAILR